MSATQYDAIVVGARCAGSPVAMLLARKGYKVLCVDRGTFPSDTVSTHLIHPQGMAALKRWGLYDAVVATNCPPIDTYVFDFGPVTLSGSPGIPEQRTSYSPRRTVLDKILVDAASGSGVEVREAFTVEELVTDAGKVTGIRGHDRSGSTFTERARVIIGADGRHSKVAQAVHPQEYNERPVLQASYYSYWSDLPVGSCTRNYIRGDCGFAAWPTNDDLTLVIAGWSIDQFEETRKDIDGAFMRALERAPEFAEQVRGATREERYAGAKVPNYFRKPFGPGWALVGDAAYNKDFITAQGISDAFRDAELCTTALDEFFTGERGFDDAMATYQKSRDEHVLPTYEFTLQIASLQPPPPEQQQLFGAMAGNQEAMDGFVRTFAGATSPAEFFAPDNVEHIFAQAGQHQ